MPFSENQKRQLRKLGHDLKPVVIIGSNGFTDAVNEEIALALDHHELIKVRVNAADRELRNKMIKEICNRNQAELIQRIGHIALLFRRNKEKPRIEL
ncbi:MAG TPA: ribosome assembly RNA-binding protein YhbY [Candidatus Tenderia sp.]|nr:ribosome assembly RNA-binding protein YhbY [Candidatus Tenderia sp.]